MESIKIAKINALPLTMRLSQTLDFIRENGLAGFFRETIYYNREAVVAEKDLFDLRPVQLTQKDKDVELVEITYNFLAKERNRVFPVKNRYFKCWNYLGKGYGGFAVISDNKVIGDVWYKAPDPSGADHPDCSWLGVRCSGSDVYTFDMYVDPAERGNNVAVFLQNRALLAIKEKGFKKAYGFFWADNIPALWAHRTQKWKETNRVKRSRFLFLKTGGQQTLAAPQA